MYVYLYSYRYTYILCIYIYVLWVSLRATVIGLDNARKRGEARLSKCSYGEIVYKVKIHIVYIYIYIYIYARLLLLGDGRYRGRQGASRWRAHSAGGEAAAALGATSRHGGWAR